MASAAKFCCTTREEGRGKMQERKGMRGSFMPFGLSFRIKSRHLTFFPFPSPPPPSPVERVVLKSSGARYSAIRASSLEEGWTPRTRLSPKAAAYDERGEPRKKGWNDKTQCCFDCRALSPFLFPHLHRYRSRTLHPVEEIVLEKSLNEMEFFSGNGSGDDFLRSPPPLVPSTSYS